MERKYKKTDFCKCQECGSVTTEDIGFGFWLICCDCGMRVEDSFKYYNHFDGEDHEEDLY